MLKEIRKYTGFVENAFKVEYAYKFRALIWSISSLIFMFIQYYLWKAIFTSNGGVLYDITVKQYIAYIGIGLIVYNLTSCFQDLRIAEEVKSGNISVNLLKPFSYRRMVLARHIGGKFGSFISQIPMIIIVAFFLRVNNVSGVIWLEFLLSIVLSFILIFLLCYFVGVLTLWFTNYWGLHVLRTSIASIFSGQVVAIDLFRQIGRQGVTSFPIPFISPEFIQSFFRFLGYAAYALPFQAMYYTPVGIYTGMIKGQGAILLHLLLQVFWIVFLYLLSDLEWKHVQKKITILGG